MSEEKKEEVLEQEKELDENEMETVAGGGDCGCALAGGGEKGDGSEGCFCFAGGGGKYDVGGVRCACPMVGAGVDKYN